MAAITKMNDDACREILNAIVIQACKDYRNAYRRIATGTANHDEEWLISDALQFFGRS